MWANLIDIDWEKVEFVADPRRSMAKEMPKISNDGRTFTFTLRDDLKFSDGQPVTSVDFQYAFEQASKKENNWVGLTTTIDRIEVLQDAGSEDRRGDAQGEAGFVSGVQPRVRRRRHPEARVGR